MKSDCKSLIFKYFFIFISLFVVLNPKSFAQTDNGIITGTAYKPENEPAMFSTAVLMNTDSVFMNGMLIGEDGTFLFNNLKKGSYHIMIRSVEFNPYVSDVISINGNDEFNLGSIQLKTKLNDLEEIVIKGEKAIVEVHADKMVYNVSSSVNATGNNALELISKSPGVRVDMDNNIMLQGKSGVQVYINGRPSRMSGSDLSNMLEGMQSENIESLEIITNPSSKYDAEGTGGIINIVLKKDLRSGFNGNVNGSYSQGEKTRSNLGTSLNYSGNKLNLFSSINVSDNNYLFDLDEVRLQDEYSYSLESYMPTNRKGINYSGGLDYKITKEHVLSFDARIQVNERSRPTKSTTIIEDLNLIEPNQSLIAGSNEDGGSGNYNANVHYSFIPNRSSEFSADISFGTYDNNRDTYQPNTYYSANDVLLHSLETEYNTYTGIDLFSAKADYRTSFSKTSLSTGVKYSYINTNNSLEYYNIENSIPSYNTDRSNDFNYLEKIAAAYAIFNWNPTDKINTNAGLRVENTSSLGKLVSANPGPDDVVPRNYTSLFPNISFAYDDKTNHNVSLSYGRRITRPNYHDLNPFESRSSELSAWKGNPFLKPNYIDNYQISYSYKRKLVISNTYSITHDYFANVFFKDNERGSILSPRNMDEAIVNGLSVNYPLTVNKWWKLSAFAIYNYENYKGDIEGTLIDIEQHIVNFRLQNNIKLPWKIQMELSGYASSESIWRGTVYIEEHFRINAGIKKSLLNDKLLIQASARDIFDTGSRYHFSSDYGGIIMDGIAFFDGRRISFNASYKFGNQNIKSRRSKSSLDKELNRISD